MADLKFIECHNRKGANDIEDRDLTDYMFMMYRRGEDGWYKNSIFPVSDFKTMPLTNGAVSGVFVHECIRVTLDKNGKIAFVKTDEVIKSLCDKAKSLGFAEVDSVYAKYAFSELLKTERQFLQEGSYFIAHFNLFSLDKGSEFPVKESMFTINLEYRKENPLENVTLCTAQSPVKKLCIGTVMTENAKYVTKAAANAMGYDLALLTDCVYDKYILGASGMNVFFRTEKEIFAPGECDGFVSTLVKELMTDWGLLVSSKKFSTDELWQLYKKGEITEAFCVCEKELVIPVTEIETGDGILEFQKGKLARKLYDSILNIERGILLFPKYKMDRV